MTMRLTKRVSRRMSRRPTRQPTNSKKLPARNRYNSGFTLLELTAAIAIWMILLAFASQMLLNATRTTTSLVDQQDALERARVAVDYLTANVQLADRIELTNWPNGMMRRLNLHQICLDRGPHWYRFRYGFLQDGLDMNYNEIARNLSEVRITFSDDRTLMFITVTSDTADDSITITLTGAVDIRYKNLTVG